MVGDISKVYDSIKIGLIEKYTRGYRLRFSKDEEWKVYGVQTVMLGDRPTVGLITCAIERGKESI